MHDRLGRRGCRRGRSSSRSRGRRGRGSGRGRRFGRRSLSDQYRFGRWGSSRGRVSSRRRGHTPWRFRRRGFGSVGSIGFERRPGLRSSGCTGIIRRRGSGRRCRRGRSSGARRRGTCLRRRLISRLLQGINQIVAGALVMELLGEVGVHLEVHTPLLDFLKNFASGASEQEQRDVVLRQRLVSGGRDKT